MRRHIIMLTTTIVVVVGAFVATLLSDNRPVLGLDLQGGVSVVLFPVEGTDLRALDTATEIIRNRVDALGIAEPDVNRQGDTIVVDLPGVKDTEKATRLVGQTAELRFRPYIAQLSEGQAVPKPTTATTGKGGTTTTTGKGGTTSTTAGASSTTTAPKTTTTKGSAAGTHIDVAPIASIRPAQESSTSTKPPASSATTTAKTGNEGSTTSTTINPTDPPPGATCKDLVTPRDKVTADGTYWLPSKEGGCMLVGPAQLTGKAIKSASAQYNSSEGWTVLVHFKNAADFDQVAQANYKRPLPVELDGVIQTAPTIQEQQFNGTASISGSYGKGEASELALVLRYGSLPVQFDQSKQTSLAISPSLGKDQLHAGIVAGIIGLALVALYMIIYYRLLGLVVWLGLGLTGMVLFTIVSYMSTHSGLTLTLAGVTGMIVSVGVTVDSYVVYFERLKDEVRTGKTVRSSLEPGFRRAFRTIIAADLVSLLGAVVLWLLTTSSVKGFAFFLGLSTAIDLVLSYVYMYPLVSILALRPNLVKAKGIGIADGLDVAGAQA